MLTHVPPQFSWNQEHDTTQVLKLHTRPAGQLVPQVPQFFGSLLRLTHLPPHGTYPARQLQTPFAQRAFAPQEFWQAPQLATSEVVLTQVPLQRT